MRGFGYASGALYSFLLDEFDVDWKTELRWDSDLGALLQEAAGISELTPFAELDLTLYGYEEVTAFELAFAENNARLMQEAQEIFSGQVLYLDTRSDLSFGEVVMLHVPDLGIVYYGSLTLVGEFGRLEVTDGFFFLGRFMDYEISAQAIEKQGNRIIGQNWVLELNEDFEINNSRIEIIE